MTSSFVGDVRITSHPVGEARNGTGQASRRQRTVKGGECRMSETVDREEIVREVGGIMRGGQDTPSMTE